MAIKFKAWDKREQRYRDDVVVSSKGVPHIVRSPEGFNEMVTKWYKDNGSTEPQGSYLELDYSDHYASEFIEIQPDVVL